jgi:hypothetical protein
LTARIDLRPKAADAVLTVPAKASLHCASVAVEKREAIPETTMRNNVVRDVL